MILRVLGVGSQEFFGVYWKLDLIIPNNLGLEDTRSIVFLDGHQESPVGEGKLLIVALPLAGWAAENVVIPENRVGEIKKKWVGKRTLKLTQFESNIHGPLIM